MKRHKPFIIFVIGLLILSLFGVYFQQISRIKQISQNSCIERFFPSYENAQTSDQTKTFLAENQVDGYMHSKDLQGNEIIIVESKTPLLGIRMNRWVSEYYNWGMTHTIIRAETLRYRAYTIKGGIGVAAVHTEGKVSESVTPFLFDSLFVYTLVKSDTLESAEKITLTISQCYFPR